MKSNIGKLFSVLVVGGSLMTQTAGAQEQEETCQLEVTKHSVQRGQLPLTEKTCIDGKTNEEILTIIENYKKETCLTPFCGCWLG